MRGAMKSLAASAFATMGIAALAATPTAAGRAHTSKHRQFDQDGDWIPGKVKIAANSSLRKLMRAARRGLPGAYLASRFKPVVRVKMGRAAA